MDVTSYVELSSKPNISVVISQDEMSATMKILPMDSGEKYTERVIRNCLKESGVVQGIIVENILAFLHSPVYYNEILVAQGKEAVNGTDGYYEYFFKTKMPVVPYINEDDSVDYMNLSLFEQVEQDALLAQYHEATSGGYGFTVTGKLKTPKKGKDKRVLHGKGIYHSEDHKQYYAATGGKVDLREEELELNVSPILVINGDADYSVGNIKFIGDVQIKGDVMNGLIIEAGGNLEIAGHVGVATIRCGGDLVVKAGVQGSKETTLDVNGYIYGKFFEAASVFCKKDITANYIMNCDIVCDGEIHITGRQGVLLGGTVSALRKITALSVGNEVGIDTRLQVGVRPDMIEEYSQLGKTIFRIESEIKLLENARSEFELKLPPEQLFDNAMYKKILIASQMKEEECKNVMQERHALGDLILSLQDSRVEVKGTCYAGVSIMIDTMELTMVQSLKCICFRKVNGQVVVREL